MKIPKALSSRVFDNGYSKHFRDMTSGIKLKKMIKEHVWKKNAFSQTHSNKAGNGFENSKGSRLVTVFLITVTVPEVIENAWCNIENTVTKRLWNSSNPFPALFECV